MIVILPTDEGTKFCRVDRDTITPRDTPDGVDLEQYTGCSAYEPSLGLHAHAESTGIGRRARDVVRVVKHVDGGLVGFGPPLDLGDRIQSSLMVFRGAVLYVAAADGRDCFLFVFDLSDEARKPKRVDLPMKFCFQAVCSGLRLVDSELVVMTDIGMLTYSIEDPVSPVLVSSAYVYVPDGIRTSSLGRNLLAADVSINCSYGPESYLVVCDRRDPSAWIHLVDPVEGRFPSPAYSRYTRRWFVLVGDRPLVAHKAGLALYPPIRANFADSARSFEEMRNSIINDTFKPGKLGVPHILPTSRWEADWIHGLIEMPAHPDRILAILSKGGRSTAELVRLDEEFGPSFSIDFDDPARLR